MLGKLIILGGIAVAMATSASAAYLSDIEGAVLVNNQPVSASLELAQGDRVKVVKGSANLVYSNGATVRIAAGQTLVVLANPLEQLSMNDGGLEPLNDNMAGLALAAGGAGLAVVLSRTNQPASP
jgi:hypothetical protein